MSQATVHHLSFSQVKQYRTCSEQYRLERIERVPSRPSCPAEAGKAVHTGTETVDHQILSGNDNPEDLALNGLVAAQEQLDEQVTHLNEKGWPPDTWRRYGRPTAEKPKGEDLEWFRVEGVPNAIRAYVDWRLENAEFVLADIPGFGPAIEVPFEHYINGQPVHGYIDRIFTSTTVGGWYPFDLKSGQKPKTDEQLGLYAAALRRVFPDMPIVWGYFLYALKTGKAKITPPLMLEHWTDSKLESVYGPATLAINAQIFMPSPGEACRHCSVTDSCSFFRSVI